MKHIVILNRMPIGLAPYHLWLDKTQYQLHIFCQSGTFSNEEKTKAHYLGVYEYDNYTLNGNIERDIVALGQEIEIHSIVAFSEYDIIRAAKCRDALGIAGQSTQSAMAFRDKLVMREYCQREGIDNPKFEAINDVGQLCRFIETNGYPVIVKPRVGMAGAKVFKLDNDEQLRTFLEQHFYYFTDTTIGLIAESFITGDIFHVDGLLANGELMLVQPMRYVNSCLDYASGNKSMLGSVTLTEDEPLYQPLVAFTKQILAVLPHCGTLAFHLEAFVTPSNEIYLCEVASRNGGAWIVNVLETRFGINADEINIRLQASHGLERQWTDKLNAAPQGVGAFMMISFADEGTHQHIPKQLDFDFVKAYEPSEREAVDADNSRSVFNVAANIELTAQTIEQMYQQIEAVERCFES